MQNQDPAQNRNGRRGLFARLRGDTAGNTLAIMGAALLPLTAMIGSGVDMSRAYMAKTRLQSACDAAALAGRRVLMNDTLTASPTDPVRVEADKFLKFNFPDKVYGTTSFTPVITKPEAGTIRVSAETEIPTGIMYLFGFENLPLSVSCEASQNFVNTDVLLVLDVTGSMLCETNGSDCDGDSNSKIAALREAVLALYDELEPVQTQLEAASMRLRYGIVPYSSGVNVGGLLLAQNRNYIAGGNANENWTYQSRSATTVTQAVSGNDDTARRRMCTQSEGVRPRWDATYNDSTNLCTLYPAAVRSLNVSSYVSTYQDDDPVTATPNPIDVAPYIGGASRMVRWAGCIEERQSTNTITSTSGYAIPDTALDLNIDFIPTSDITTKWKPYWPEVSFKQDNGTTTSVSSDDHISPQVACPNPSKRLQAWTRDNLETYVDALAPTGGTYHDNGIIWGARLISAGGVFADSPDEYLQMPVSKHIIFMTDGLLDTGYDSLYTTYGLEKWDARVGGTTESAQATRHRQRFKMVCNAAKSMNVSIWVVAFATAADADLKECASSASQVSTSTNKAQLIAKFAEIGKNIGALRLTQ